jgi:adenylylsulfate kinase
MSTARGFGIWITGLPASGKSSITRELVRKLALRGVTAVVLESDEMRKILTPDPTFSPDERDRFYRMLVQIGELLARSGVNVIFDATGNKRAYRDHARSVIGKFVEVFVDCPLAVCMARDPKGLYAAAARGTTATVPGVQSSYEAPLRPELTVDGQAGPPAAAEAVLSRLQELRYI